MERKRIDNYIGLPYSARFDCADFAVLVAREVFDVPVESLPGHRPRGKHVEGELAGAARAYARRVESPIDGSVVLMFDFGDIDIPSHVGIYVKIGGNPYVLHSAEKLGGSALTPVRHLGALGIRIEGYYEWLQPHDSP